MDNELDSIIKLLYNNSNCDTIEEQIEICNEIVKNLFHLLTLINENNGKKKAMMLLHHTIKKNYKNFKFNSSQNNLLIKLATICKQDEIDAKIWLNFSEKFYNVGLYWIDWE